MFARSWIGRASLAVWGLALVVGGATAAAADQSITWTAMWRIVIAGVLLLALAAVVGTVSANLKKELLAKYAWTACGIIPGISVVVIVAASTAHVGAAVRHPQATIASSLLIGLAAWGSSIGAGVIASLALAVLMIPILGVFAGLLAYGVFELVGLGILGMGRGIKGLFGKERIGPLNPVAKPTLY